MIINNEYVNEKYVSHITKVEEESSNEFNFYVVIHPDIYVTVSRNTLEEAQKVFEEIASTVKLASMR